MPDHEQDSNPTIRRARFDSLSLYEISEEELNSLEKGSTESILLNFAIFTISIALGFFIPLITTPILSDRTYYTFVIITILGFLSGIILIVLWLRERKSSKSVCRKIRARMKEEKIQSDRATRVEDPTSTLGDVPNP